MFRWSEHLPSRQGDEIQAYRDRGLTAVDDPLTLSSRATGNRSHWKVSSAAAGQGGETHAQRGHFCLQMQVETSSSSRARSDAPAKWLR